MAIFLGMGGMIYAAENEAEENTFDPLAHVMEVEASSQNDRDFKALPEHEKVAREMELQEALKELDLPENDLSLMQKEVADGKIKDSRDDLDAYVATVKWQNTLLGVMDSPLKVDRAMVNGWIGKEDLEFIEGFAGKFSDTTIAKLGLYKGDLASLSFTAADALSDVWLYKSLTRKKIEIIIDSIKNDYNGFIRALSLSLDAEDKHELSRGEKGPDDFYVRSVACAHMRKYISQKHRLMGAFPFNKHVLAQLVLRWGWEKVSVMLKDNCFPQEPDADAEEDIFFRAERIYKTQEAKRRAFVKDANGNLKAFDGPPPFSMTYCFSEAWNFFYPSSTDFGKLIRGSKASLEFLNEHVGLYIPQFLFHDYAYYVYDFLGIGFSAQSFDDAMGARWAEFAVDKRKALKIALDEYKKCIENPNVPKDELKLAENTLWGLVEEGLRPSSWFPMSLVQQWKNFRQVGSNKISTVTGYWVAAVGLAKGLVFGKKVADWWYKK